MAKLSRYLQHLLLAGFLVAPQGSLHADDHESADDADTIYEMAPVTITGTRINSAESSSPSPIVVLSIEDIKSQGMASIGDVLQTLTVQSNAINTQSNNGGDGSTRISLRGLGSSRTLVLVNGRRFVPGGTGANSSVDLNSIPASVIERIEVLKDGASAVYGSDAVGGLYGLAGQGYSRVFDEKLLKQPMIALSGATDANGKIGQVLHGAKFEYHAALSATGSDAKFADVAIKEASLYCGMDVHLTKILAKTLRKNLEELDLDLIKLLEKIEQPLEAVLAEMESTGIHIDIPYLEELSTELRESLERIEQETYQSAGIKFNLSSPKQLGEIIYNDLKIAGLKKTKKGSFATSASVLEDLAFKGHEFPKLILDWRQVSKLKNTYSDALPEHLNPNTKRVHTSFLLAATTTGRLASSDPNLQNIPIKSEDGKDIRKAFTAKKGHLLISADYNQIEMRILADLADVKELKKAFKNKEDIHSLTASQIFNIDIKKVNQDHRRKAKAINFGIIYGISQYGLAKQINVSNYEAEEFLNSYFAKFPEIKVYMDNTIKFCRKSGYVNNIFGRRSHFNGINDKNFNVRNFQERAAINAPIQGSASEVMRLAMIRLDKKLSEEKNSNSKMLLQIHDELIFEIPKKDEKVMIKLIEREMTSVAQSDYHSFSTPLTVDINVGDNWGMLH